MFADPQTLYKNTRNSKICLFGGNRTGTISFLLFAGRPHLLPAEQRDFSPNSTDILGRMRRRSPKVSSSYRTQLKPLQGHLSSGIRQSCTPKLLSNTLNNAPISNMNHSQAGSLTDRDQITPKETEKTKNLPSLETNSI